ncbi:MAG: accessory gene regulator B family protein [Erysipelotrichaceae bacterium]|nr:accessory gene regulator B family protein [Erysipelotrichaceae bacterium]
MLRKKIKKILLKSVSHDDKRRALAEHGIDILISDSRNLLCVFLLSFFLRNTELAILYMLVLSTLRVHTGGWHASSELKCFITYQGMFLFFSLLNTLIILKSINTAIMIFSVFYIIYFSPVEHKYNPLSAEEIKRNRIYCFIYCIVYSVLFLILIKYSYVLAQTIAITLLFNVVLMELLRKSKNYRYYDY